MVDRSKRDCGTRNGAVQLTIDIRISGCQTQCWHCYVNGGTGPNMTFREIAKTVRFLQSVLPALKDRYDKVHPYLDLEPVAHPDIVRILDCFAEADMHPLPAIVPTTGIGLFKRSDCNAVLSSLRRHGVQGFELTLHGVSDFHDFNIQYPGGQKLQMAFMEKVSALGFRTSLNIIVSRHLCRNFDRITELVIKPESYRLTIPCFESTPRLRAFELHRALAEELAPFVDTPFFHSASNAGYWQDYLNFTGHSIEKRLKSRAGSWDAKKNSLPQWVFVVIRPGLDICYGNGNLGYGKLGNAGREMDLFSIERALLALQPNYCNVGELDISPFPDPKQLLSEFCIRDDTRVYANDCDILLLCLDRARRNMIL